MDTNDRISKLMGELADVIREVKAKCDLEIRDAYGAAGEEVRLQKWKIKELNSDLGCLQQLFKNHKEKHLRVVERMVKAEDALKDAEEAYQKKIKPFHGVAGKLLKSEEAAMHLRAQVVDLRQRNRFLELQMKTPAQRKLQAMTRGKKIAKANQ